MLSIYFGLKLAINKLCFLTFSEKYKQLYCNYIQSLRHGGSRTHINGTIIGNKIILKNYGREYVRAVKLYVVDYVILFKRLRKILSIAIIVKIFSYNVIRGL